MRLFQTKAACLSALLMLANLAAAADGPKVSAKGAKPVASRAATGDLGCLAEAVYFEAGGTGLSGQAAVAHVVVNRAKSAKFPRSVCGVVGDGCQFSYRCDGRADTLDNPKRRAQALAVARDVLSGAPDITKGALFFHSAKAAPGWFKSRPRVGVIGGNIFYR